MKRLFAKSAVGFGNARASSVFSVVVLCSLLGVLTGAAQTFPPQGDDTTTSMGVFRITVAPAFRPMMGPVGALVAYAGFNPADGRLTSPLVIDSSTTIGRSGPNARPYPGAFPVAIGAGSWDSIANYAAYPLIPPLWAGAPAPTEEVLTEIKSFILSSVSGSAGQHCVPDSRVPMVPLNWPMIKAGTFAGVSPRSIGMVQENVPNGAGPPDFPAHSFFDIFVEVSLPPIPSTESAVAFPPGGAILYNDSPLVITNLNLGSFPPTVIYIHGETPAVPIKFKVSNPPYWNAGDLFGYLVLAGHGTISADCSNPSVVGPLLDAVLGPIGTSKPELPIEWPRTNILCPSPGSSYDTVRDTDIITFPIPGLPNGLKARNIIHTNLSNPIIPPALGASSNYSSPNTLVRLEASTDGGNNWAPAQAIGNVLVNIQHASDSGSQSNYNTEMLALNLQGSSPFGPFMIRESPTKQSLGKHTIGTNNGGIWKISSFFDVFLEVSVDGGASWVPADRSIRVQPSPPPPPAITLTCSSNITVRATSASGAVVTYTSTASGGCPPVNVNCNPSSGSTFPVGMTVVTCTATDACGQTTNCSFTVTVLPPIPDYFSPFELLPPPTTVYISPALYHVLYNNGIIIRDIRHRFFTSQQPPPPLGTTQVHIFSSQIDYEVSFDNGATFQPGSGTANVQVKVTHSQDNGGTSFYDTEMLQLNLTGSGFMLRESPTLQSTGQTTVRPVTGGFMIGSFFDVFTELSTDGGVSWTPGQASAHVELRNDPIVVTPVGHPTRLLPPPTGGYVSPQQWHALFAQGIVIKDVSHKFFTTSLQPPAPGAKATHAFNSMVDLSISTDGGATYQSVRVSAPVSVDVSSVGSGNSPFYDTEMTSLTLQGLPAGVMIRESPTLPSRGGTLTFTESDGSFRLHSFFDIFPEVSLDGGATWSGTTNGPVRMELRQVAPEVPKPDPNLPPLDGNYISPQKWHALYANGIIITNASHDRFLQTSPPPPPGGNQTENFGSRVTGLISLNGGASFQPFSATANVSVHLTSRSDLDTGPTRFFDTEMLLLDLSGLPSGVMVRESPSKASLGRTSVRQRPSDFMIDSFFDVFTEVSLDGGATWSPTIAAPGTMGLRPPLTNNPVPIVLTCSSNITVNESVSGGAFVLYSSTATGGCPPVTVSCVPPSGSFFPVGTTVVTCTASDSCGSTTNCSFTVTVVPEFFNPTNTLPPSNSVYISPALYHVLYASGIIIRDVRHRFFTQSQPPPPVGGTVTETFSSQVDCEISLDGGATFQPVSAIADVSVKVTHTQDTSGGSFFDTEMLSLTLTGLPAGVMIRESPTLASLGKTSIRTIEGGYMISGFFDIFTEVSTDGGSNWTPAQQPAHVEVRNDPRQVVPPVTEPTNLLPPPTDAYISPAKWHALYAQGIFIKDVRHKLFTQSLPPPPAGASNVHTFDSTIDLQISLDGGNTYQFARVSAPVQVVVKSHGSGGSGMFDTEMTGLTLSGLPNGVMIRESPSKASRGATQIDPQPDGTFRIGSFFDIFTEISLDGGATWTGASNGPVRVQLTPLAPETPVPSPNLPMTNSPYVSPADWHAAYANGIYITNIIHRGFTESFPPPPPGGSQNENFGSTVEGQISTDGGLNFTPFSATANVGIQVTSSLTSGQTRFFNTEMLSMSLSGLPGGVMIRESPTRASTGRTSVRPDPSSGGFRIGSFFDVFTEISTDGGATWLASTSSPAMMSPRLKPRKRPFPLPNIPGTNSQYISPKQWHALYANGIIISNVTHKRFLASFPPPPPRTTNIHNFGSIVNLLLSMGPGQPFVPVTANADCLVSVGNSGFQGTEKVFQTEMLSLNLSGGSLPPGTMIRESPTRRSTGETHFKLMPGGGNQVSSFFDVFTEISTDGGNTWSASDLPGYMEMHIDPGVPPTTLMQPRIVTGKPNITVQSQIGLRYLLQYKTNLSDPTWTTLSITSGNGQQLTLSDDNPAGQKRFYRIEVQEDDSQSE